MAWVHSRLCKLQKGCTWLAATSHKVYQLLAHGRCFSRVLRLLPPLKLVASLILKSWWTSVLVHSKIHWENKLNIWGLLIQNTSCVSFNAINDLILIFCLDDYWLSYFTVGHCTACFSSFLGTTLLPDRVKPNSIKLVFVASPISMQH
jgi:hypothetical protein